ncbi:MAG TPA: glycosyltransferase [Candidatus Goldiibacteriota bacterium]|nr:glycosyltransferase [Candidatus Goldiibacteriota bacterium]
MKILVLSSQAKNTGSTLRAFYLYKYLKKQDSDVDFIEPPFKSMPFMFDFFLSFFYYFFKILNKRYEIAIVVKPYPNTVLPCLLLKARKAKIIIDVDDLDYGYRKGIISDVIEFMQGLLIPAADLITSHNEELIKLIKKKHPEFKNKIYLLKQCVDLSVFGRRLKEDKKIKERYEGKKILFYMANMNVASYFEDVLAAVSKIKTDYVLFVVGGGPLLGHYKKITKQRYGLGEKVVFFGSCDLKTTAKYLSAADLCLVYYRNLPVNKYRASMKLREYLAMNKPVVANDFGEIKLFKDYVYASGPALSSFATEIKKRIKCLDKRHKKGYKFIRKNYDWEDNAKKFYKFITNYFNLN